MALDVDRLRGGLQRYREALQLHRAELRERYKDLNHRFKVLFDVYGGNMAEDLRQRWEGTARWFEGYLNRMAELERFLDERLEHLDRL